MCIGVASYCVWWALALEKKKRHVNSSVTMLFLIALPSSDVESLKRGEYQYDNKALKLYIVSNYWILIVSLYGNGNNTGYIRKLTGSKLGGNRRSFLPLYVFFSISEEEKTMLVHNNTSYIRKLTRSRLAVKLEKFPFSLCFLLSFRRGEDYARAVLTRMNENVSSLPGLLLSTFEQPHLALMLQKICEKV